MRGVQEVILDIPDTALQTHLQFYSLWAAIAVSCSLGLFLVLPAVREKVSERKEYEGLSEELHQQAVEFETQSLTDFQTGLCNRSRFEELLAAYVGEFQKQNVPLGLMIFDIDHCRAMNENHGQQVGDQVVVEVAKLLKTHVRQEDFAARIGGDEFAVVIPNIPRETLLKRAQFLGHEASNLSFQTDNGPVTITVSGGVSSLMPNDTVETFRQRADDGLVFAKNSGRNKVCA